MLSLSADSTPLMSYAKTINRLAVYARLLLGFTAPAAARHSGIGQQAEQDRRYGSSLLVIPTGTIGLCALVLRWTTVSRQGNR
jgi:hypothetical protein